MIKLIKKRIIGYGKIQQTLAIFTQTYFPNYYSLLFQPSLELSE